MSQNNIKTDSGIPIKEFFSKKDIQNRDESEPGTYPFLRGLYPSMYRERLWTMRQYSGFGSAEETNNRFKFLLEHGQTGLSLAFDLPTQTGRDSDDRQSEGEIGRTGVPISSIADMLTCFKDIPLDKVSTFDDNKFYCIDSSFLIYLYSRISGNCPISNKRNNSE